MENPEVAQIFDEVADLLALEGENPFRIRAYRRAWKCAAICVATVLIVSRPIPSSSIAIIRTIQPWMSLSASLVSSQLTGDSL